MVLYLETLSTTSMRSIEGYERTQKGSLPINTRMVVLPSFPCLGLDSRITLLLGFFTIVDDVHSRSESLDRARTAIDQATIG